jgi:O-acetyl-ADP-ribose deacetylase (regulator of RNase III)
MEASFGRARLFLMQGDITRRPVDAIVNAANSALAGGGGVDGAIHRAAGPELMSALDGLRPTLPGGRLPTGEAVITPGFGLHARWVIHCAGPIYASAGDRAPELLSNCYRAALRLCREHGATSVAFPSISTGAYGYPLEEAAFVALTAVRDDLLVSDGPGRVEFVLFDARTLETYRAKLTEIA